MRISELSIYDWVMAQDAFGEYKPQMAYITELRDFGKVSVVPINGAKFITNIDHIQPINLTTELLELNNWEISDDDVWENIELNIYIDWKLKMPKIKYLHELQHLYRMKGLYTEADRIKIRKNE